MSKIDMYTYSYLPEWIKGAIFRGPGGHIAFEVGFLTFKQENVS